MWVSQEQAEALGFVWSLAHVVSILCYALLSTHEMVNDPGRSRSPIVFWAVILVGPIGLVLWLLERPGRSSPIFIKSGQDTTTWMDTPPRARPFSHRRRDSESALRLLAVYEPVGPAAMDHTIDAGSDVRVIQP